MILNHTYLIIKFFNIDPLHSKGQLISKQNRRAIPSPKKQTLDYYFLKGQIISECPYEKIVYPKIATKKFQRFLSWPLRRGQIKKIKALYYINWGIYLFFIGPILDL